MGSSCLRASSRTSRKATSRSRQNRSGPTPHRPCEADLVEAIATMASPHVSSATRRQVARNRRLRDVSAGLIANARRGEVPAFNARQARRCHRLGKAAGSDAAGARLYPVCRSATGTGSRERSLRPCEERMIAMVELPAPADWRRPLRYRYLGRTLGRKAHQRASPDSGGASVEVSHRGGSAFMSIRTDRDPARCDTDGVTVTASLFIAPCRQRESGLRDRLRRDRVCEEPLSSASLRIARWPRSRVLMSRRLW